MSLFVLPVLGPSLGQAQFSQQQGSSPLSNTLEVNVRVVPYLELTLQGAAGTQLQQAGKKQVRLNFGTIDAFGVRKGKQSNARIGRLPQGGAVYSVPVEVLTRFSGLGKGQGKLRVERIADGHAESFGNLALLEGAQNVAFEQATQRYAMVPGRINIIASGIENNLSTFVRSLGVYVRPKDEPGPRKGTLLYTFTVE